MPPLVSICLPNLNTRPFLEERMETILAQTMTDWELIVCDSYSNDGSWEFFQKFKNDPRVRLYQVPREGMYAGWNECLKRVKGQFVYFATSDDTAKPTCLERLSSVLSRYKDVDLAICGYEAIDEASKVLVPQPGNLGKFYGAWQAIPHRRAGLLEFFVHVGFYGPSWGTMTAVLFRSRLLEKTGGFRTDCGSSADWFWAIRTALFTDTVYMPDVLATWRVHPSQATKKHHPLPVLKHSYRLLQQAVLDSQDLLPASVTDVDDWLATLLRNYRGEYLLQLGLDRRTIQAKPMTTVKGVVYGLLHEPRYVLARLLTGLTWEQEFFGHEEDYLQRLMSKMQVPWPPEPVGSDWCVTGKEPVV